MATIKELGNNKIQIEFEISADMMQEATTKAYQKNKGRYNVPGFRKGHAPKAVLERYYGEALFVEDAFDIAFPDAYRAVIDKEDIFVVSQPENLNILSMELNAPVSLTVEVYVKPEVELGEYKGVEVAFKKTPLAKNAVKDEIQQALEKGARYVDVERAAKDGDRVIIDYSGSVDGVKFDGGTAEGQTLDLGSGTFIPGFEEQVVGMKVGETKDIEVTFPGEYHEPSLAGKLAIFTVTVGAVKEKELPEQDDEFAQDVSEFDTFDEYKKDIQKKLKEKNETENKNRLESLVVEKIVENAKVEIPHAMIHQQIDNQLQEMSYNLMYQGMSMDQYLGYMGITMEQMQSQMHEPAEQRVKTQLVLEAIKNKESIKATQKDIDKMLGEFATMQNKTFEEYKKDIDPEEFEYITNRADYEALGNFLVKNAKVVEPQEEKEEEKPAKKAPAKKAAAKPAEEKKAAAKKTPAKKAAPKADAEENKADKKPAAKKTTKKEEA